MMNSYNQPCFRGPVLRRILTMQGGGGGGERETSERPGVRVQGEVARLTTVSP